MQCHVIQQEDFILVLIKFYLLLLCRDVFAMRLSLYHIPPLEVCCKFVLTMMSILQL